MSILVPDLSVYVNIFSKLLNRRVAYFKVSIY